MEPGGLNVECVRLSPRGDPQSHPGVWARRDVSSYTAFGSREVASRVVVVASRSIRGPDSGVMIKRA